ncbi:T9SS type A sorting domain-containing protein [Jejuia spongiicola]|uniref:T9SS type A sorting domain-containing protein n=1 Tax=Jejuia spongiicola TaxID=2942207 RepID=A0ABT0QDL9_9FLAO|nr:T9SS type A sorting domain-containing protein [Jejuia spongiicola]MCL6294334.1 T9SS type A sorting domain-containing protein [Jejuia spongiicola]
MGKIFFSTFFFLITFTHAFSQCPNSDIVLKTQADIDNFATNYPGCTNLSGSLTIGDIPMVTSLINNLSGLSSLTSISGNLYIFGNSNISSLTGLDNIETIGNKLSITGNNSILNFNGLNSLKTTGELDIRLNDLLENFSGLSNLTTVSNLTVSNCPKLKNFIGLESVTAVNNFASFFNDNLENFNGLNNLNTVSGSLNIEQCNLLKDLTGLNDVTSIGITLRIFNNNEMINLNGLEAVKTIGAINISDNNKMQSLDGLDSVISLNGYLGVFGNMPNLVDISALSNIEYTTIFHLYIQDNINLSVCEEPNICEYLNKGNPSSISGNSTGCTTELEVVNKCTLLNLNKSKLQKVMLYPNPSENIFFIEGNSKLIIESIKIYNTEGFLIKDIRNSDRKINIENFSTGMYLVSINTTNHGKIFKKIIKL